MSRPITHKIVTRIVREKQKNGSVYVCERTSQYDPEKRYARTLSKKIIGKIMPGSTEIIPTRPRRLANAGRPADAGVTSTPETAGKATRFHVGMTDLLAWVGEASGIDRDLRSCLESADADKLITVARYLTVNGGGSLAGLESWQINHEVPYAEGVTESVYHELFSRLGKDEDYCQQYFKLRAARVPRGTAVAYDSTTVSTYSQLQIEARQGFNKDGDGLNTIKVLVLYALGNQQPIAFAKQPGNIPDVVCIKNALQQLQYLNLPEPEIVTDQGYYSEENLRNLIKLDFRFLTMANRRVKWIKEACAPLLTRLNDFSSYCPFDPGLNGVTVTVRHDFPAGAAAADEDRAPPAAAPLHGELYLHLLKSYEHAGIERGAWYERLSDLRRRIEAGETDFSLPARNLMKRFLTCTTVDGHTTAQVNEESCRDEALSFGTFALVSNHTADCFTALATYRRRNLIESLFRLEKGAVDGQRPRVWNCDLLKGRMLAQFVALGYISFLYRRLDVMKQELKRKSEDARLTAAEQNAYVKLGKWVGSRSLQQILKWFDCTEATTVPTPFGRKRWTTENTQRDRLFVRSLKMTSP